MPLSILEMEEDTYLDRQLQLMNLDSFMYMDTRLAHPLEGLDNTYAVIFGVTVATKTNGTIELYGFMSRHTGTLLTKFNMTRTSTFSKSRIRNTNQRNSFSQDDLETTRLTIFSLSYMTLVVH